MIPTTQPAHKISALFNRRPTTHWSEREVKQYKKLVKDGYFNDLADLELVIRYTMFERRKEDKGIHRRDLATFINNFPTELDRARAWDVRYQVKKRPWNYGLRTCEDPKPTSDEEFKRLGDEARKEMERLRQSLRNEKVDSTIQVNG